MKYSQCSVINCTAVKHYDQLFLDKQLSCASFLILKNGWGEEKPERPRDWTITPSTEIREGKRSESVIQKGVWKRSSDWTDSITLLEMHTEMNRSSIWLSEIISSDLGDHSKWFLCSLCPCENSGYSLIDIWTYKDSVCPTMCTWEQINEAFLLTSYVTSKQVLSSVTDAPLSWQQRVSVWGDSLSLLPFAVPQTKEIK